MLTKAFQDLWATSLESDKYKQGSGQLRNSKDEHCCLGVAADLLAPDKWVKNSPVGSWGMRDGGSGEIRCGYLTTELREQIGLDELTQTTLVSLNDDILREGDDGSEVHANDFKAIGKYIRSLPTRD